MCDSYRYHFHAPWGSNVAHQVQLALAGIFQAARVAKQGEGSGQDIGNTLGSRHG